jgi:effector-binding domain-containing protein
VRAGRPPGTLFTSVAVEVYVPVRRAARALSVRRLAPVRAATILHRGAYDGFDATQRTLEKWVGASGLTATGEYRVVYLQFGAEDDLRLPANYVVREDADLLTELQVLVT